MPKVSTQVYMLDCKIWKLFRPCGNGQKRTKCDQFFCPTSDFFDFCNSCFFCHTFNNDVGRCGFYWQSLCRNLCPQFVYTVVSLDWKINIGRLREKSRSRFSRQESRFLVLFSLFSILFLPWKTVKCMQNSATFDKIFLPRFTKSNTFWLHVNANVKRTEFIMLFHSNNSVHCRFKAKENVYFHKSNVRQCRSPEGRHVLIWGAWHTPLKQWKNEKPKKLNFQIIGLRFFTSSPDGLTLLFTF